MGKTSIEWTRGDDGTAGSTWNPVRGCSRVSPGCGGPNHQGGCYAEKIAARFSGPGQPFEGYAERGAHGGRWTGKLGLVDDMLTLPLRWRKPRRVFVNSMSDLFHEALPDEAIDKVFAVMALCPQHTFQVLTKRATRMREYFSKPRILTARDGSHTVTKPADKPLDWFHAAMSTVKMNGIKKATWGLFKWSGTRWEFPPLPLPNVWLGVSVEDQERADERIPDLLSTPAAKLFLSCEPLLGPVVLQPDQLLGLDWIIVGGESGPGARPMHPDWARSLRDQCQAAGVSYFFKQWGEWLPGENYLLERPAKPAQWQDGETGIHSTVDVRGDDRRNPEWRHFTEPGQPGAFALRVGKRRAGAMLDGREWREFPA